MNGLFWIALFLIIVGGGMFGVAAVMGSYVDGDGILHEPGFGFAVIGMLSFGLAVLAAITGACLFFWRRRKSLRG
ncbi:DUF3955 domain-containing protein [Nitratireductor luteus]|uniref:DUF3955 domain-containing protein n=1 Tax=Nitratireductor luteus TaxID=2976980 RepID=UPI002240078B